MICFKRYWGKEGAKVKNILYICFSCDIMKKISLILSVCVLAAIAVFACASAQEDPLLGLLDETLEMKETYQGYFKKRIAVLEDVLAEQVDPEQVYNIRKRMALTYKTHSFDSTLKCLMANRDLAISMNDQQKIAETDFMLVEAYTMAGYHVEAGDILDRYSPEFLSENLLNSYYNAAHCFYGETMAYTSSDDAYAEKGAKRDRFRDILLEITPGGTLEWYYLKREEAESAGDILMAREYALKMMECTEVNTPDYARSSYFYANTFNGDSPDPRREEWLIRSAIADLMCATNDYASLNEVSRILFERGDIDRAFRYVADHCMADALAYNGKLRAWQISQFFPEIERAYQQKHLRQTKRMAMMMFIAVALLALLLFLLLYIFKRQQILDSMRQKLQESYVQIDERNRDLTAINNRLVALNSQMQEADKVKQEYIALFLGILSENINKTRQYRHHVLKAIRQGNTKALEQEIELLPSMDDDILEFYKMFDETFVNLYPDFVEKFNELLVEGAAIVPKGDDILTPELRIFALIKLGITDSSKIAALLHYSANTIYNYRAKIKNKARGSRSEFEAAVRNIE